MAPVTKKSTQHIQHFTHPGHPLIEVNEAKEYLCDGCKTLGSGKRYRCDKCEFDLHEHCGTCPMSFSSYMHPQHQITLVLRKPQATRQIERHCNVCGEEVEGLFYRCKLCEFDVHPICTQLPQNLRHAVHPHHLLTLLPSPPSWCTICRGMCTSWRYKCGPCGVDLHLQCVLAQPQVMFSPPPSQVPYGAYSMGIPFSSSSDTTDVPSNQAQRGIGAANGKMRGKIYAIVGKLALGVLVNGMFGMADFSSF